MRNLIPIPVVMMFLLTACVVVEPGEVGVQTFMGSPKERVLDPGMSFPNFNSITHVSLQQKNFRVGYGANHVNAAVSSDMQTVGFSLDMSYFYTSSEHARNMFLHVNRNPESWSVMIIEPTIDQAVKTVFARHTLREIVANREQIRIEVAELIRVLIEDRLTERHPSLSGAIRVSQVALTNLDYSREFEQVIEETQREEQRILLARNELERVRVENERQLVEAEAERLAAVERARGEAEALEIRTQAQVEAYRLLRESGVDPNYYRFIEKWDGNLPTVMGADATMLMDFR